VTFDVPQMGGVAPATPRRVKSTRRAGRLRWIFGRRAARDTCAPRAMIRQLSNRNQLSLQDLRFFVARGARGSRDTSAAQRLSNDFSYLLVSICFSRTLIAIDIFHRKQQSHKPYNYQTLIPPNYSSISEFFRQSLDLRKAWPLQWFSTICQTSPLFDPKSTAFDTTGGGKLMQPKTLS